MSSKCLTIHGCIEGVCPYFKRTHHYDYDDELTCTHPHNEEYHNMHEYEYQVEDDELWKKEHKIVNKTYPANCWEEGLFPLWCKLENSK